MTLTVRYFASLRDHRGVSQETLETPPTSVLQLYLSLNEKHQFPLSPAQVRYVVNGAYVDPSETLQSGDEVVFIPPVAGG